MPERRPEDSIYFQSEWCRVGLNVLDTALFHPEVVLLDLGLPGLDGYEVAKRLRQQPTLRSVVLVAMTGYGQEPNFRRSHDSGFNHHLVKPVDFAKVREILATVSKSRPDPHGAWLNFVAA